MQLWIYFLSLLALVGLVYLYDRKRTKSLYPLLPNHINFGKRRVTLKRTLELLEQRQAKTLVETGIARKGLGQTRADGASTIVFGKWAILNDAHLYSVDIDPEATQLASRCIQDEGIEKVVSVNTSDSVAFLQDFNKPVDFLYLDSYDFPKGNPEGQRLSQEHHLKELKAIENRLHQKTVILIDDCKLPNGGKGKLATQYLLDKGWQLEMKKYQFLFTKSIPL